MDTPVMITMANGSPEEWIAVSVGIFLMCTGIWLAGYRWGSAIVACHFSWAIYLACFTKGDFWWMSGWMWYDRTLELGLFSLGSLWALLYAFVVIGGWFIKESREGSKQEPSPGSNLHPKMSALRSDDAGAKDQE